MIFAILGRLWRKSQRETDILILWPACKEQAKDIQNARGVFFAHCAIDPVWYKDYTDAELIRIIDRLN